MFFSRFLGAHISRHLNFAILRKICIVHDFNFAFLSKTEFISLSMLRFNMFLNEMKRRFKRYNNVKVNKNATVGLSVAGQ